MTLELSDEEIEIGRKTVEDALIELRDMRVGIIGRNNGLVCKEKNGEASAIIRLDISSALQIAVKAINEHRTRK